MSDKDCPAGKIPCEHFVIMDEYNPGCKALGDNHKVRDLYEYKQCPWPSKQKLIKDWYIDAWERYNRYLEIKSYTSDEHAFKEAILDARKEAGLE